MKIVDAILYVMVYGMSVWPAALALPAKQGLTFPRHLDCRKQHPGSGKPFEAVCGSAQNQHLICTNPTHPYQKGSKIGRNTKSQIHRLLAPCWLKLWRRRYFLHQSLNISNFQSVSWVAQSKNCNKPRSRAKLKGWNICYLTYPLYSSF